MPMIVSELYQALLEAGVGETLAREAAHAVIGAEARTDLVTKADLFEMESRLIKWNVGAMAVLTAIFAAIVRLVP